MSPFKVSEASCQIMCPSAVEVVYVIVLVIMKLNKNELYVDSSKSLKYSSIPNTFHAVLLYITFNVSFSVA